MVKSFVFTLALIVSVIAKAETYYLGDIEGNMNQFDTLVKAGVIKIERGEIIFVNKSDNIVAVGDIIRRGPHGEEILQMLMRSKQVHSVIGNHDINGLSYVVYSIAIDEGLIPDYNKWAEEQKLTPEQAKSSGNKLWWWMNKLGLQDKVTNFWIEQAIKASGKNYEEFLTDRKPDLKKLGEVISGNKIADAFFHVHAPGGDNFEYLREMAQPMHISEDGRVLTFHSGQPTPANFGKVSGVGYVDITSPEKLLEWQQAMSDFKHNHLNLITSYINEYSKIKNNPNSIQRRKELAKLLWDDRFRIWGDAGWDHSKNTFAIDADSFIYPDKRVFSDTALPGIPDPQTVNKIVKGGVEVVIGGHFPVGAGPVARIAVDKETGKRVLFLTIDSSYSPVEGNAIIKMEKDGSIKVEARTVDSRRYVMEYPKSSELERLISSQDPKEKARGEALSRYGYAADGYIIIGNVVETVNGEDVVNYDNFMLVRQDGHNFSYKTVDIWGIMDAIKLGKYDVPKVDFKELRKNAKDAQKQMLANHDRADLSLKDLNNLFADNSKIHLISGPSESSFEPLNRTNGTVVENYLREFEGRLRGYDPHEKVLILGGGTKGLESEMLKRMEKVSAERVKAGGVPFEAVGFITGVTSERDLEDAKKTSGDLIVKKYYRLEAFYWDDYWGEMLKIVNNAHAKKPFTQITLEFGGGGGILPLQILRDTMPFIKKVGKVAKVILNKGLNQIKEGQVVKSGTDKSIEQIFEGTQYLKSSQYTKILEVDEEMKSLIEIRDTTQKTVQSKTTRSEEKSRKKTGPDIGKTCEGLFP
ncbi:MAG: metallophosphoesterase family protein [Bdellovibrio sp.]